MDEESFTDKIEPYGVRAYRIKIVEDHLQVAMAMTPMRMTVRRTLTFGIVRQLMMAKLHAQALFRTADQQGRAGFLPALLPEVILLGTKARAIGILMIRRGGMASHPCVC